MISCIGISGRGGKVTGQVQTEMITIVPAVCLLVPASFSHFQHLEKRAALIKYQENVSFMQTVIRKVRESRTKAILF